MGGTTQPARSEGLWARAAKVAGHGGTRSPPPAGDAIRIEGCAAEPKGGANAGFRGGHGRVSHERCGRHRTELLRGCLVLEAGPGKTGRPEFQGGCWKRDLWCARQCPARPCRRRARTNRKSARTGSGRQGGGEARNAEDAGQCRSREGASGAERCGKDDSLQEQLSPKPPRGQGLRNASHAEAKGSAPNCSTPPGVNRSGGTPETAREEGWLSCRSLGLPDQPAPPSRKPFS